MTLLNPLEQTGFQAAMDSLHVGEEGERYSDEQFLLSMVLLSAWGVLRVSHINDQPTESWGALLDTARRPDGDRLDQWLKRIIEVDEEGSDSSVAARLGQIRGGGAIDTAQQESLRLWTEAGLLEGDVWYFDGHTIEYSGEAAIGKTKHGTKQVSVKAVERYTLCNGLCSLSEYFPTSVTYIDALRLMVAKANRCLPPSERISKLAFDKEGWEAGALQWLAEQEQIALITWVKNTTTNVKLLAAVPDEEFVAVDEEMTIGKVHKNRVAYLADTTLDFSDLGCQRVVVLEMESDSRIGIYTTALHPREASLEQREAMSTIALLDALRLKQRIENGFKVDVHEMASDAIPTHQSYAVSQVEPYDREQAQRQHHNAQRRLVKYTAQAQQQEQLHTNGALDQHQFNLLHGRSQRLRHKAEQEIEILSQQLEAVRVDEDGQATLTTTSHVLDVRKLTLLNLIKSHARVALTMVARLLGLDGAGPQRLRREFLAFGDRVEFDHERRIVTVYARPFPRARSQQAYERLCGRLFDVPITLTRDGVEYRVRFSW